MDPLSGSDRLRGGPGYDFMASPNVGRAIADAPTLMSFSQQPNLGNFFDVLKLAARVFADKTNPTRPDMSLGIMPGMPNPQGLPLTKVMEGGQPTRVYHGTQNAFEQFDPAASKRGNLYGPGFYFTEDPRVASSYAATKPGAQATPNVRPANLDITKPLDMDADLGEKLQARLVEAIERKFGRGAADHALDRLDAYSEQHNPTAGVFYKMLSQHAMDMDGKPIGQQAVTNAVRELGFDGITHMGGANTGTAPHRVWISFKPEQIVNPFEYEAQFGVPRRPAVDAVSGQ